MGKPDSAGPGSAWKFVLPVYLFVRVALTLWMWGVRQVLADPISPDPVLRPYLGVAVEGNPWLEPWQRWDTLHYQAIAERGYAAFEGSLFTPPLLPGLMRAASRLTGAGTLVAGLVISNLAYLAGLVAFFHLARLETKDERVARRATIYLALFPTSFFFLAAYTESLVLLGAALAIYAAQRGRWWLSGASSAAAALARLIGAALVVPFGLLAWRESRQSRSMRPWLPVIGAAAGAGVLPLYAWLGLGLDPLAPVEAQIGRFRGGFALPGTNLLKAIRRLVAGEAFMADAFDLVFLLLFIACGVVVWRKYSRVTAVFYVTFLGLYLVRLAGTQPLLGTSRYVLTLFPAFLVLGEWGGKPWVNRVILYSSTAGLLFLSGQFAIWGWVG